MNYSPCSGEKIVMTWELNSCLKKGESCTVHLTQSDIKRWIKTLIDTLEELGNDNE
jgi:hypothetical protein